jgi:hypothetical protein
MKRFVTLLTVSVTLAGLAFAGNRVTEPDFGSEVGFPFHPGAFITNTLDTDYEWYECFCVPSQSYEEFPVSGVLDPTLNTNFDVMRMTSSTANPGFQAQTYIQNPQMKDWNGRVLDMTFYFAVQENADALAYYISDTQVMVEPTDVMDFSGLAFIIDRDSGTTTISIYEGANLVASADLGTNDSNFHLIRVLYDDLYKVAQVEKFEMFQEVVVLPWTQVYGPTSGWLGFGAFAVDGGYQYIDDICLTITDESGFVDATDQPTSFDLAQNFPNPFNPATTISFNMDETAAATLKVYDLAGREVATLVDGMVSRGEHSVVFDGASLTSGVYFYTLETAGLSETRKMVLVK